MIPTRQTYRTSGPSRRNQASSTRGVTGFHQSRYNWRKVRGAVSDIRVFGRCHPNLQQPRLEFPVLPLTSASSLRTSTAALVVPLSWEARAARVRRQLLLFRFRAIVKIREGLVRLPASVPLPRHFEPRLRTAFIPLFALGDERPETYGGRYRNRRRDWTETDSEPCGLLGGSGDRTTL